MIEFAVDVNLHHRYAVVVDGNLHHRSAGVHLDHAILTRLFFVDTYASTLQADTAVQIVSRTEPQPDQVAAYQRTYAIYTTLYGALKESMHQLTNP